LSVEDSGLGVPEAVRGQIFEPFFTTKPEGEGSGLGLSVSYGIVREHGGQIWVEDSALGGASFVLELAAVEDRAGGAVPAAAAATVAPNARPSPRRVLLVDDEESIRATAQRILQRHGHDVDVAADGAAALLLLEAMEYDIVLCDLRMPNLSGAELYAELRRRGLARDAQFVVTTGDIADADAQRFLGEGQVPVLIKAFELTALLEAVER
jgi:two-component system NtrC family sensor kinase